MSFIPTIDIPERLRTLLNRARPTAAPPGWYKVSNSDGGTDGTATVMIYDDIGGFFGVNASEFAEELNAVTAKKLTIRLNSPGGAVDQGISIANLIRSHDSYVTVVVDGMAASIASVIAMAGDEVVMMPQSQLMIHEAFGLTLGNKRDFRKMIDVLERCDGNIAAAYRARAGGSQDSWLRLMEEETWYSADEAVSAGLADRVAEYPRREKPDEDEPDLPEREYEAAARWDLSVFRYAGREKAPDPLAAAPLPPSEPDVVPEPGRTVALVDLADVRAEVERAVAAASADPPAWFTAWAEAHADPELEPPVEPYDGDETPDGTAGPADSPTETPEGDTGTPDDDQPDVEPDVKPEPDPEPPADDGESDWSAAVAHLTAPADPWAAATAHLRGTRR
jgi:ATP-dependent protease ClpP protease subunit